MEQEDLLITTEQVLNLIEEYKQLLKIPEY